MIGYIETLDKLCYELHPDLATDVILQSLPASYEPFILNFQMNGLDKTLSELHGMLKTAEESIKKNPNHVMMIQKGNKKRKRFLIPKVKARKRVPTVSPRALSRSQHLRPNLALLLRMNASNVMRRDIGLGIARSTWKKRRRRREVRLPLQV
jgi:hypothetical protein